MNFVKNDRKNKIPVVFLILFRYDKTKKYLKEAENYDIVFTNKKARQVTNPKESLVARDFYLSIMSACSE